MVCVEVSFGNSFSLSHAGMELRSSGLQGKHLYLLSCSSGLSKIILNISAMHNDQERAISAISASSIYLSQPSKSDFETYHMLFFAILILMYYRAPEIMLLSVFHYPVTRLALLFSTKMTHVVTALKPAWITQHN